jgi:hypothetical protein
MRILKIVLFVSCFSLVFSLANAANDGFGPAKEMQSKHFEIFYSPQLSPDSLLASLDIGLSDLVYSGASRKSGQTYDDLGRALDTLYSIVMRALDMNLYSLQGKLKVCSDRNHLNRVYENIFGRPLKSSAFYIHEYNTIYISGDDFTKAVLGHEIAHMLVAHYFVVQPPERTAEILSGYVEYQLRKSGR